MDESFKRWQEQHKTKKCPKCEVVVERTAGCNCMKCKSPTCKGKTEFCYRCGKLLPKGHGDFKGKGTWHECPLFDR